MLWSTSHQGTGFTCLVAQGAWGTGWGSLSNHQHPVYHEKTRNKIKQSQSRKNPNKLCYPSCGRLTEDSHCLSGGEPIGHSLRLERTWTLSSFAWACFAWGALVCGEYWSLLSTFVFWCNYHNYLGVRDREKLLRLCWVVTSLGGGDLGFPLEWVALSVWIVGLGGVGDGLRNVYSLSSLSHWLHIGPMGHEFWISGWWLHEPREVLLVLDSLASIGKPGEEVKSMWHWHETIAIG